MPFDFFEYDFILGKLITSDIGKISCLWGECS